MTEQRKNQRYDLRLPCEILRAAQPTVTGETRNMSSSGVLFTSPGPVSVGETIEYFVTFPKPPGSPAEVRLRCVGKVLRAQERASFAATLERYEFIRDSA
ncbi:MAG TPA: PilZ domain-containing protein [Bryobacteraceae bacterium]|nr:PilZ domain-containing protein [Bryobacteraceae bacterium]